MTHNHRLGACQGQQPARPKMLQRGALCKGINAREIGVPGEPVLRGERLQGSRSCCAHEGRLDASPAHGHAKPDPDPPGFPSVTVLQASEKPGANTGELMNMLMTI